MTCAFVEVEIVARSIEVGRQQEDRVEAVLLAIRLRADEHRLLCDPVGRVRLLRIAVPEVVLVERHRRELRIRADRPDDDELRRGVQARLLEDVRSHREIRVPVATGVGAVRADSADLGGEVKHELGVGVVEHTRRVVHRGEVVVGAPRREDVMPFGFEALDEVRAEKASAAGNERAHRRRVQATPGTAEPSAARIRESSRT